MKNNTYSYSYYVRTKLSFIANAGLKNYSKVSLLQLEDSKTKGHSKNPFLEGNGFPNPFTYCDCDVDKTL